MLTLQKETKVTEIIAKIFKKSSVLLFKLKIEKFKLNSLEFCVHKAATTEHIIV